MSSSPATSTAAQSPLQALAPRPVKFAAPYEVQRIPLTWLLQLRWGALLGKLITVLFVDFALHIKLPMTALFVVLAFEAASNVVFLVWTRHTALPESALLVMPMALDIVLLTAMLLLTGGPFNPFSFLYLVHIALAAVVLSARLTWSLVALSLVCFGMLFLVEHWLPVPDFMQLSHQDQMRMHMQGMWIAFAVAAVFITYFVTGLRHGLAQRELELARARSLASQSEKLASLATLATGAAHELSTPLSTIAVIAKELERALSGRDTAAHGDAQLIRREVERCREILQRMAADAGQSPELDLRPMSVQELLHSALEGLPRTSDVRLAIAQDAATRTLRGQAQATAQALRGVLKNALQASPAGKHVEVDARIVNSECRIGVRDFGAGMTDDVLARAGEPFFTTKEPGEGMGLGLFLTRVVVDRMGGHMAIHSQPGHGTTAILALPIDDPATSHRIPT